MLGALAIDLELADVVADVEAQRAERDLLQLQLEHTRKKRKVDSVKTSMDRAERAVVVSEQRAILLEAHRDVAMNVMATRLDDVVSSINLVMEEIVAELFPDDDLRFTVENYKEKAKDGSLSPAIMLRITNNGTEYSLAELSGGELDRLSLCFTLAISTMNHSPLVIFDEIVSSMDVRNKNACLSLIRQHMPNKHVIVIAHDTDTALFDSVCSM
jgi:translation initiation factor RLI1